MVLVVLFPLPDEKNRDVKTIFTCSQTCLLDLVLEEEQERVAWLQTKCRPRLPASAPLTTDPGPSR